MILLDRFNLIAPEFIPQGSDLINSYLSMAAEEISPYIKGVALDIMTVNLAAHYMTIALKRQGAGGEVTSISEGKLSMTFSSGLSKIKSDLSLTSYGRTYERYVKSYTVTPLTRACFQTFYFVS